MIVISELLDAITSRARTIPELVDSMNGDPDNITTYDNLTTPTSNVGQAVTGMLPPSILLVFLGTELGLRGQIPAWLHNFGAYVKVDSLSKRAGANAHDVFRQFISGVPDGETEPMLYLELHPDCDPMDGIGLDRAVGDDGTEYWVIRFTFAEKGPQ